MNLLGCPLGAMPVCHGSGGLAGQYCFGARTGGSMILLGTVKIALGLALGGSLLLWLQAFPRSVLGVLLLFSGAELASVCRDQNERTAFFVMALTAAPGMATNMAWGFAAGWLTAALLQRGWFRLPGSPAGGETKRTG